MNAAPGRAASLLLAYDGSAPADVPVLVVPRRTETSGRPAAGSE
jgi:hypothetical protein